MGGGGEGGGGEGGGEGGGGDGGGGEGASNTSKAMAFTRSCTRHMAMNVVSSLATCAQDAQQHRHVRGGRARMAGRCAAQRWVPLPARASLAPPARGGAQ